MVIRFVLFVLLLTTISCGPKTYTYTSDGEVSVAQISYHYTNIFLLERDGRLVMIDAGYAKDSSKIESAIKELGYSPKQIEYIILTHGHEDHVGTAAFFKRKYGSKIVAGEGDVENIETGTQDKVCPTSMMASIMKLGLDKSFPPVGVDLSVPLDQPLLLTYWKLELSSLPGHTPGSIIVENKDRLFVGDLIRGRPLNKDAAAMHYFMCDEENNLEDIRQLLERTPEAKTWYPGHFGPLERDAIVDWLK